MKLFLKAEYLYLTFEAPGSAPDSVGVWAGYTSYSPVTTTEGVHTGVPSDPQHVNSMAHLSIPECEAM